MRRMTRAIASLAAITCMTWTMSGCDKALVGKYEEVDGAGALEFHGNQVFVTLAVVGTTFAADYEIDGNQIVVNGSGPANVYALNADGSIETGAGLRFVRTE